MATVTKKELVDRIAEATGQKRTDVKVAIQMFLDEVVGELASGNRLEFRDFGVFEVTERASRIAQNPKTLERVHVPAKRTVRFKSGRLMKQSVEQTIEPAPTAAKPPETAGPKAGAAATSTTDTASTETASTETASQVEPKPTGTPATN